ncbi:MAG: plasmid pRiA4b ORF-3 family protein [Flavobacteriaceae bacterium]|nr:plasmid pRiA4b ORF-3 family protein [Flavobacteriaceae bacterium]
MIYKVRVIADLEEDVARDIAIRSTANLEDLHNVITNTFGFDGTEMASFYKADNECNQGDEIPLYDISEESAEATDTMKDFSLTDLLTHQEDKLIYVYDFFAMWTFLVELIEITNFNKEQDLPKVLYTLGNLPTEAPEKQFKSDKLEDGFDMYDEDNDGDFLQSYEDDINLS